MEVTPSLSSIYAITPPDGNVPADGQVDAPNLLGTLSQLAGLFGGGNKTA